MEEKRRIRRQISALRSACTDRQVREMSEQIAERLFLLPAFQRAERILAYADYNHEVQTGAILEAALRMGKETAVPRVLGREMEFFRITDLSALTPGYRGIPEPPAGTPVDWQDAFMIMPGVAFDTGLRRIGYGGGFYDRYLERHPMLFTAALAFEFQIMERVPCEPGDICPQLILTENRTLSQSGIT